MAFEHKPGSGSLFKNTDGKGKAAYSGNIKLPDGTDCFIDLYPATERDSDKLKTDKNGNPFYNVRVKPKDARQAINKADPARQAPADLDDDIAF